MALAIREANLDDAADARVMVELLDAYAAGPSGGGVPLSEDVKQRLAPAVRAQPGALVLLAFVEGVPAGVATCFPGFSTFYARPLLNVHDLAVLEPFRRRGIGRASLGVQTLDEALLQSVNRQHGAQQALDACAQLLRSGRIVNVDLIYGRNITGENANWITLASVFRFPAKDEK